MDGINEQVIIPQPLSESQLQRKFVRMIGELITWVYSDVHDELHYELTFGEAWRTPEQAALDAAKGIGILHSLHTERLAVDFNLWVNGVFQTDPKAYEPMGEMWEVLGGTWGGRFASKDNDHFSLAWGGRK